MTASQIARTLRARRIASGKWMCRCVAHPDKTASLSITDMGNGRTRLHCFSGCSQKAVLEALGLQWSDLTADKPLDREAMRAIEAERQRAEKAAKNRRRIKLAALVAAGKWERVANQLGMLLDRYPNDAQLGCLFDWALSKMRQCEQIAVNFGSPGYGFPKMGRKAKLTREDVGPEISMRLGIYRGV